MASSSSSRRAAGWLCLVCLVSTAAGVEPHVRVAMQTGRALRRNSKTLKGIFGTEALFGPREIPQHAPSSTAAKLQRIGSSMSQHPTTSHGSNYVAMCLAVKDQHADIREWLEHHMRLGVGKFYIYDNNSSRPMLPEFFDLVRTGQVEYTPLSGNETERKPQLFIYDECLRLFGSQHTWMAFVDADEFLVLRDHRVGDLPSLLQEYEAYGALVVNWQIFGSSGWLQRPPGGTLASYTACLPRNHSENLHVKTIAHTRHTLRAGADPHHFVYAEPYFAVNEAREQVDGAKAASVSVSKVAVYHYATKSQAEYKAKMQRGSAMGNQKSIHFMQFIDQDANATCADARLAS